MHKKRIGNKDYFYTSRRDSKGKVETIYLGSKRRQALKREKELGLSSKKRKFNLHLFFIVFLILSSFGFFAFTGFNIINISDESLVDNLSDQLYLEEEEVSMSSLEDSQSMPLGNETSSSLIQGNNENISFELNQSLEENLSINGSFNLNASNESELNQTNLSINFSESLDSFNISLNLSDELNGSNLLFNLSEDNMTNVSTELVLVNFTLNEIVNASVETIQYGAVINEPVKWKKIIILDVPSYNLTFSLPIQATNLSIIKIQNGSKFELDLSNLKIKEKEQFVDLENTNLVTGGVVFSLNSWSNIFYFVGNLFNHVFSFTGFDVFELEEEEPKGLEIIVQEQVEELEVEYETPGPNSTEINITKYKKQIVISSDIHYKNILAFTYIENTPLSALNLYWLNNNSRQLVEFDGYDSDGDELVDYIEWVVPNLSNQTYELEIRVLNVQSYPSVGGNWTVLFTTSGNANLTITGINNTNWSNESENSLIYDLKVLELTCGQENINFSWNNNSLFVEDYECNSTGNEVSKVLTPGKHALEFEFGGQKAYAYNDASSCTSISTSGIHYLTNNISAYNTTDTCIIIDASDVTLDCSNIGSEANYLDGEYSASYNRTGIYVNGSIRGGIKNVTIQNCNIYDFTWDIVFYNVTDSKIINNNISIKNGIDDTYTGIVLEISDNILIQGNRITSRGSATYPPTPLSGAITLTGTSNSEIRDNTISDINGDGIFLTEGLYLDPCKDNLIKSNNITNTLSSGSGVQDYAAIRLFNCDENTIDQNVISSLSGCGSNCNRFGILLAGSYLNNITNNDVLNTSRDNIFITSSDYNRISNNIFNYTITAQGEGLELVGNSVNNSITNNTFSFSASTGIVIQSGSNENNFTSNKIFNNSYGGVEIYDSYNNTFNLTTISDNYWSAIYFQNTSNNIFISGVLTNNDISSSKGAIGFAGSDGGTETFLNMSFNQGDVNFTQGSTGEINVKWYFDVHVNDSAGDLLNANVSAWQTNGSLVFSELTDSSGNIVQKNLTEYVHNSSGSLQIKSYWTNYTLNTSKLAYTTDSRSINLTNNTQENVTLGEGICGDTIISSTTLTTSLNCSGTGIIIGANDIELDCSSYTINYSTSGDLGYGVNNTGYDNVTIQNCNIVEGNSSGNGKYGIYFTSAENGTITNNNISTTGADGYGMRFSSSSNNNTITGNNITTTGDTGYGMYFVSSSHQTVKDNDVTTNGSPGYGMYLSTSSNSTITNNNISTTGADGYGMRLSSSSNNNTITGNNITTTGDTGYGMYFASSSHQTVKDNNITTNGSAGDGMYLYSSSNNNTITDNNITTNGSTGRGIYLSTSSNSTITNNEISTDGTYGYGMSVSSSSNNNTITGNNITTNGDNGYGMYFDSSSHQTVKDNNITTNGSPGYGMYLYSSSNNNTITDNNISTNGISGRGMYIRSSLTNTITNNDISTNGTTGYGMYLFSASNSTITDNEISTNGSVGYGMWIRSSSTSTITNNTVSTNGSDGIGIYIRSSLTNTITNNDISTNGSSGYGMYIYSSSNDNEITNNNITSGNSVIILDVTGGSYTNTLIYNNSYGEVNWFNKTDLSIGESGTIGLGTAINISNNSIVVDSASYNDNDGSGLNQSANLTFFGVSITESAIAFRNGEDCGAICGDVTNVSNDYYFNVSQFTNYSVGDSAINCGDTITSSTILSTSLTCSGTAITIGANDIVLDCDSKTINYSTSGDLGYGVNNSEGYDNVTIKNCNIVEGNSSGINKYGIYFTGAENGTITNNNITTNGNSGYGINIYSSSNNNTITNNDIITIGDNGYGMSVSSSSNNNTITGNNITTTGDTGYGMYFSTSPNSRITNNNIITTGDNGYGMSVSSSSNLIITNNDVSTNGSSGYGISLWKSSNENTLTNNEISTNGSTGYGMFIFSSSKDNTITNNNITSENSYIILDGTGVSYTNTLIYNNSYGEVNWFDKTDLSINESGTIGLGTAINISNNSIVVDSSSYNDNDGSGLNQSANLTFFGVSITESAIAFRNGEDCGAICGGVTNVSNDYYFNVSQFTNYSVGDSAINCGDTITSSTTLITDLTCPGTAITIGANDIELDCSGWTINYSTSGDLGYGVNNTGGYDNVIIQNCNIVEGNSITDDKYGIYFTSAETGTITNNNITTTGDFGYGLYLSTSNDNTITNNNITTTGDFGYGMYLYNILNSTITNNEISANGSTGNGMYLAASSNNNTITNNDITTNGSAGYGIRLALSSNSTITNNDISTTKNYGYGMYIHSLSNNNTITNNNISTTGTTGYGMYLSTSSNNNTITNNNISTTGTTGYGMYLSTSSSNTITNNNISTSKDYGYGMYIYSYSNNNIILNNKLFFFLNF